LVWGQGPWRAITRKLLSFRGISQQDKTPSDWSKCVCHRYRFRETPQNSWPCLQGSRPIESGAHSGSVTQCFLPLNTETPLPTWGCGSPGAQPAVAGQFG
jgi:hypothetical protein